MEHEAHGGFIHLPAVDLIQRARRSTNSTPKTLYATLLASKSKTIQEDIKNIHEMMKTVRSGYQDNSNLERSSSINTTGNRTKIVQACTKYCFLDGRRPTMECIACHALYHIDCTRVRMQHLRKTRYYKSTRIFTKRCPVCVTSTAEEASKHARHSKHLFRRKKAGQLILTSFNPLPPTIRDSLPKATSWATGWIHLCPPHVVMFYTTHRIRLNTAAFLFPILQQPEIYVVRDLQSWKVSTTSNIIIEAKYIFINIPGPCVYKNELHQITLFAIKEGQSSSTGKSNRVDRQTNTVSSALRNTLEEHNSGESVVNLGSDFNLHQFSPVCSTEDQCPTDLDDSCIMDIPIIDCPGSNDKTTGSRPKSLIVNRRITSPTEDNDLLLNRMPGSASSELSYVDNYTENLLNTNTRHISNRSKRRPENINVHSITKKRLRGNRATSVANSTLTIPLEEPSSPGDQGESSSRTFESSDHHSSDFNYALTLPVVDGSTSDDMPTTIVNGQPDTRENEEGALESKSELTPMQKSVKDQRAPRSCEDSMIDIPLLHSSNDKSNSRQSSVIRLPKVDLISDADKIPNVDGENIKVEPPSSPDPELITSTTDYVCSNNDKEMNVMKLTFSYLDTISLLRCRLVCRRWQKLVDKSPTLCGGRMFARTGYRITLVNPTGLWLWLRTKQVESFDLRGFDNITLTHLKGLVEAMEADNNLISSPSQLADLRLKACPSDIARRMRNVLPNLRLIRDSKWQPMIHS